MRAFPKPEYVFATFLNPPMEPPDSYTIRQWDEFKAAAWLLKSRGGLELMLTMCMCILLVPVMICGIIWLMSVVMTWEYIPALASIVGSPIVAIVWLRRNWAKLRKNYPVECTIVMGGAVFLVRPRNISDDMYLATSPPPAELANAQKIDFPGFWNWY